MQPPSLPQALPSQSQTQAQAPLQAPTPTPTTLPLPTSSLLPLPLLQRIEDAGLNASAPLQQRWVDGWLLRYSPGKARRARCINALALGTRPWRDKLADCQAVFQEARLPCYVRITPFSQPTTLDAELAQAGWLRTDDAEVWVLPGLQNLEPAARAALPPGLQARLAEPAGYAQAVGQLRASSSAQIAAHAQRLATSPVPYTGLIWHDAQGGLQACGQSAREGDFVGLYDVFTAPAARGKGLAQALCRDLLQRAVAEGAVTAYLQVEAGNAPALAAYRRLGFAQGYAYHYRALHPEHD